MASSPSSPVRMRIEPVERRRPRSCRHRSCRCGRGCAMMSMTCRRRAVSTSTSILTFGTNSILYSLPAERLGLAALAAVALDLADGEAEDAGAAQRLLHFFELERFDDCGHEMGHAVLLADGADGGRSSSRSGRKRGGRVGADPTSRSAPARVRPGWFSGSALRSIGRTAAGSSVRSASCSSCRNRTRRGRRACRARAMSRPSSSPSRSSRRVQDAPDLLDGEHDDQRHAGDQDDSRSCCR